jgi:parallel beta-helix repeat protein
MKKATTILLVLIAVLNMAGIEEPAGKKTVTTGIDINNVINDLANGDTLLVKAGTYNSITIANRKFTADEPLVIKAYGTDTVIVSGTTVSKGCSLEISGCSYIVVEGLTFLNSMWGIYVKNSDHIIIRNNEIYNTGQEGSHIGRSSKYVDMIGNKIHDTGKFNSKWAEGIYVGSGSYSGSGFPDNCEYVWLEGNHIYETGNAEGINIKGESFHVTARNNLIHDIHPGTSVQYNQAGITVEGGANSIDNNYRLTEKRDIWIENNTIRNVKDGYSDWNNGIMFFGTGVYIINNTVYDCVNRGIYGNGWKNLGLQNFVFGNNVSRCGTIADINPDLKVIQADPGRNPNLPQKW